MGVVNCLWCPTRKRPGNVTFKISHTSDLWCAGSPSYLITLFRISSISWGMSHSDMVQKMVQADVWKGAAILSTASSRIWERPELFLGTETPSYLKLPHPTSYTVPVRRILSQFCSRVSLNQQQYEFERTPKPKMLVLALW